MVDKAVNAGVDAQIGFKLQRNTALSLLLNNYKDKFKDKKYFICLEHHDDFLYCFLDDDDKAECIEAYQSKKKTGNQWTMTADFYEIIGKMLQVGKNLLSEEYSKTEDYYHDLFFVTNHQIELKAFYEEDDKRQTETINIYERNLEASYNTLHSSIQTKIMNNVAPKENHSELDNLHFIYIDLAKTPKEQENQLIGQLVTMFGDKIVSHRAALDTLLHLFDKVSVVFNQGNKARLLDTSKRVTSDEIDDAFDILTTKAKCFEYWKDNASSIASTLCIKPIKKESFIACFKESFDLFKSEENAFHIDILEFTKENHEKCESYTEHESVLELVEMYKGEKSTYLDDIQLKAIFFAAYFQVICKKKED